MISNTVELYGARLEKSPLVSMQIVELCQLYAHLVLKYGENSTQAKEVLKHVEHNFSNNEVNYEAGYEVGFAEGYDEGRLDCKDCSCQE